ncbi:hypothetical protein C8J55DRAFT_565709 [Lentinula edodes]|uniref:Uncharacterized protein n=1 Tax=Lentinula lateritia TaxID=40482 RepID=A0A9W9DEK2_9AGAR|nr:hypothetical protein C8J55DRAFT_565709 [Lentinula edodes]
MAKAKGFSGGRMTKQTAQKSTGGPAPVMSLGPTKYSATEKDTITPAAATENSGGPEDEEANDGMLSSVALRRSARSTRRPQKYFEDDYEDAEVPAKSRPRATAITTLEPSNPKYAAKSQQHIYCAGCKDGGKLLQCDAPTLYPVLPHCGRFVCWGHEGSRKCIEVKSGVTEALLEDEDNAFLCPACWSMISKMNLVKTNWDLAYPGIVIRETLAPIPKMIHMVNSNSRTFFNPLDILPMAVISISLEGMAIEPFDTCLVELRGFYKDTDVPFIAPCIEFDLYHKRDQYIEAIENLVIELKSKGIERAVVFFTTHSTPDGMLHFSPGGVNGASTNTCDVLAGIFTEEFQEVLGTMDTTLFILACGGAFMLKESFDSIGALAKTRTFDRMAAFPAHDFQPNNASSWCNLFIRRILIQRESVERVLLSICADSTSLGAHSHILVWFYDPTHPVSDKDAQSLQVQKAIWCQEIEAPFGIRITEAMCRDCGVLRQREIVHHRGQRFFTIRCQGRVQPPARGPRGRAVPRSLSRPCMDRTVALFGAHHEAPKGPAHVNGVWFAAPYVWSSQDGKDSF